MTYRPTLLIICPCATQSGYGAHSRDIVHSLISLDKFDIKIWPTRWGNTSHDALSKNDPKDRLIIDRILSEPTLSKQPEICISILVPNEFHSVGKFNIGITAGTESTLSPMEWIPGLNSMNLNIVPSKFTRDVLINTSFQKTDPNTKQIIEQLKVTSPVEVLCEGVDLEKYRPVTEISKAISDMIGDIKESFLYLSVGHWLPGSMGNDRKDLGMLIKSFLETFKNKPRTPGLLLKISGGPISVMDQEDISKKIYQIKQTIKAESLPNIYILYGSLSDDEMNDLYNHPKIKAMVSYTHGEGYGRPLAEFSAASGKPIIVSNWSGHTDFLSPDLSVMLPGDLIDVPKGSIPKGIYVKGSKWFAVNYQQASKFMTDVFFHYKKYTLNAKKQQKIIRGKFSFSAMTAQLDKIFNKYLPEFQEVKELALPKLKKVDGANQPTLPKLKKVESNSPPQVAKLPTLKKL